MELKILTFNWHEPYLCLLSKTAFKFFLVEPEVSKGNYRKWNENMRSIPDNFQVISASEAESRLEEGEFDLVIAHNVQDLVWAREFDVPKILVFHNKLTTEIELGRNQVNQSEYLSKIGWLLEGVQNVFISENKKQDWGLEGEVILPGLDVAAYGGYRGESRSVLRVGNLLRERDLMMGFTEGEELCRELPTTVLGMNPSLPNSRLSGGFDDLLAHFRKYRVYLNTTVDGYEDGYNLSMLEAMACGMPVVSTYNQTSPIVDGVNGYISKDRKVLRKRLLDLLNNPEKARAFGEKARETVRSKFNLQTFVNSWRNVIHKTLVGFLERSGVTLGDQRQAFHEKPKKNVVLDYVSYPATTAFYLERALRKSHNVITCGTRINDGIRQLWNLEALHWEAKPQDIYRDAATRLRDVFDLLPEQWEPDLYLWVETGLSMPPSDLESQDILKACYLIDTHRHLDQHKEIARRFDVVFLAQKAYVELIRESGCPNVYWLPLACDPEVHGKVNGEKEQDVGFVGTVNSSEPRRKKLLEAISGKYSVRYDRLFMEKMAELYSCSRMVFNNAVKHDLNMRVFEALCSGSLLVTDRASGSGLEEFFEDGKHLAIYEDKTLLDTIAYYLDRPEERERIAETGRQEVMNKHTYDHRVNRMMEVLEGVLQKPDHSLQRSIPEYYQNVRTDILPLIPDHAVRILEIGCGAGRTGAALKERSGVYVAGIEINTDAAREARQVLDDVLEGNIESVDLPYEKASFDCILLADVLEHLTEPLHVLQKLKRYLRPGGTVVASIPNVQYFGILHHLTEGNWTYQDEGILDRTHLRFFTYREIENLFAKTGFEITRWEDTLDPQYDQIKENPPTSLNVGRVSVRDLSPDELRRFFVFQYKFTACLKNAFNPEKKNDGTGCTEMEKHLEQARALEQDKKYQAAETAYIRVLEKSPDSPQGYIGVGNCRLWLKDMEGARQAYQKAIKCDSKSADAWLGLGLLDLQQGAFQASIESCRKALDFVPGNDRAWCALGMALVHIGEKREAKKALVRALNINIENQPALTHLLALAYEDQDFAESEKILRAFLELHPANLNVLFGLAGILYKSKRLEEARETLDLILIFNPDHKDALNLLDCIQENQMISR